MFVSKFIMLSLRSKFDLTPKDITGMVFKVYHAEISYKTAWSALGKVLSKIPRDWEISYATLPQYLQSVKDSEPGIVYKNITIDNPHSGEVSLHYKKRAYLQGIFATDFALQKI